MVSKYLPFPPLVKFAIATIAPVCTSITITQPWCAECFISALFKAYCAMSCISTSSVVTMSLPFSAVSPLPILTGLQMFPGMRCSMIWTDFPLNKESNAPSNPIRFPFSVFPMVLFASSPMKYMRLPFSSNQKPALNRPFLISGHFLIILTWSKFKSDPSLAYRFPVFRSFDNLFFQATKL